MSDIDTTTEAGPTLGSDRMILAVVAVAVLAFGGALLGGWAPEPGIIGDPAAAVQQTYDDAGDPVAYVSGLYTGGDADLFVAAVSAEAAELVGATPGQLRQLAEVWVTLPTDVTAADPIDAYGTVIPVVQAANAQNQTTWCVRPDGVLLPFCAIGAIPAELDADGLALTGDLQAGVLVPDVGFVQMLLLPEAPLTVGDADGNVIAATNGWEGAELGVLDPFAGPVPISAGETVEPGMQLILTIQQFHDLSVPLQAGTVTIHFAEGDVEVQIGQPELLLGEGR